MPHFEQPDLALQELHDAFVEEHLSKIRESTIDLDAFRGAKYFTDEEIDEDLGRVAAFEQKIEASKQELIPEEAKVLDEARLIEKIFPEIIAKYGWLGENVNMIDVSPFDDYFRGVDAVAQFAGPKEARHAGLEIDFASSEEAMKDKIVQIATTLAKGNIYSVKYFDSPATGKLKNLKMPKIAFGISKSEMKDFAEHIITAFKEPDNQAAQEAVRNHPVREKFIRETIAQLEQFAAIIRKAGNAEYAMTHEKIAETLKRININERKRNE